MPGNINHVAIVLIEQYHGSAHSVLILNSHPTEEQKEVQDLFRVVACNYLSTSSFTACHPLPPPHSFGMSPNFGEVITSVQR